MITLVAAIGIAAVSLIVGIVFGMVLQVIREEMGRY